MTRSEFKNLIPKKSMVYKSKIGESVKYMFMGMNPDGTYKLYGVPFGYEDYLLIDFYEVVKL